MLFERWRAPVYRLLIPFASGILFYRTFSVSQSHSLIILIASIALYGLQTLLSVKWRWRLSMISGACLLVSLFSAGCLYSVMRDLRHHPHWIGRIESNNLTCLLEIRNEPIQTKSGWRIRADGLAVQDSIGIRPVCGGVILYSKSDSVLSGLSPGRMAWVHLNLKKITNKPGASFDFARYCLLNKITHQGYLHNRSQLRSIDSSDASTSTKLHSIRLYIRKTLYTELKDSIKSGLATALFIGWKDGLDAGIKTHYTRTGTVHIIAISGLHIALVFEILWRLLYPLLLIRGGQMLRNLITLLSVWMFCFMAGGEASVLRAGIMFTIVLFGRAMERPVSGFQALGISMLSLMIADPDWLFDPGFQLSHSAVLGILLLQPVLSNVWSPQNPIMKNIWLSSCLTIAATIGTLPFTALYFRQFSWLFLPANLIAVPLSSLILTGLFLLIPLGLVPAIGRPLAHAINSLLDVMNDWVERLDRIPGMVSNW